MPDAHPLISFIYPCFNRAWLFLTTLESFLVQHDPPPYEILVLDDGSSDGLRQLVGSWRDRLPLRYLRLDVDRSGIPVIHGPDGSNNPAVAWNVGIREACAPYVAVSSPEVKHLLPTNVRRFAEWPAGDADAVIADVYDATWQATEFQGWIAGGVRQRPLPFLARYRRDRLLALGGFEEAFMVGRAYDDNEFADRWALSGGHYTFTGAAVQAEHQSHARPDMPERDAVNRGVYERVRGQMVANRDRVWGSAACILERWE